MQCTSEFRADQREDHVRRLWGVQTPSRGAPDGRTQYPVPTIRKDRAKR